MAVQEGQLLWSPSEADVKCSQIMRYIRWLRDKGIADCADYGELWQWSVSRTEAFWASLWDYFEIVSETPYERVVSSLEMKPGNEWFPGARVNFAEHILRNEKVGETALLSLSETRPLSAMSWDELGGKVRILATKMRAMGIEPGDAVCCLMPNIPETVIAMLAAISIGAVWSNAAPEFGNRVVLDRFAQIKPKLLFVADGYLFGGKRFDRRDKIVQIVDALRDSLEQVVYLPYLDPEGTGSPVAASSWKDALAGSDPGNDNFSFERVPHDHPLWIVFSSGTTGLPKAIVHSHIGALMEQLKAVVFHCNLTEEDVTFFYTTTGWIMFNMQVGMLLAGAKAVLYDGHPAHPSPDVLWRMAADARATLFGASPSYVQLMDQLGIVPGERFDLSSLKTIICSGSPATPETFEWFYRKVKKDLWLTSQSGGTELAGAFVGATPTQPVYAGEIQVRCLGMSVDCWDENGRSLVDEVGELVCKKPFPSMPICFVNDGECKRYNEAYFSQYPGVWRHGDFIKINHRGGCYIYGRSDSTLNRYGVRLGTAELYRIVERFPEVADSLVVCCELPGGSFFMPMFLQLKPGLELTEELERRFVAELRESASPRHVPDRFYVIPEVPYTLTGKKMEVPVRKLLMGWPLDRAASRDAMKNPAAFDYFIEYVASTSDYAVPRESD